MRLALAQRYNNTSSDVWGEGKGMGWAAGGVKCDVQWPFVHACIIHGPALEPG